MVKPYIVIVNGRKDSCHFSQKKAMLRVSLLMLKGINAALAVELESGKFEAVNPLSVFEFLNKGN